MSESNENTDPKDLVSMVPGVPMVNGNPFTVPEGTEITQDSVESVSNNLPDQEDPTAETAVSELPEALQRLAPGTARTLIQNALAKAGITPLRQLTTWNDITIELQGKSDLVDKVVDLVTIPRVFSLEGANAGPSVLSIKYMPDGLGGISRTVIKFDRRLA